MSDIDFLEKNKNDHDQASTNAGRKKEEIAWTEPDDKTPLRKGRPFSFLSFLRKEKPASGSSQPAEKMSGQNNKINKSRQEILKQIQASSLKKEKEKGRGFGFKFLEKIPKEPKKEILMDYQKVLNEEKEKRSKAPAGQNTKEATAKISEPPKPAIQAPGQPVKESLISKQAVKKRAGGGIAMIYKNIVGFLGAFHKIKKETKSQAAKLEDKAVKTAKVEPPPAPKVIFKEQRELRSHSIPKTVTEKNRPENPSSKVLETNLIKGEIITFVDWRKKIFILISAVLAPIFLISLVYAGLVYFQKSNLSQIENQAAEFGELDEKIKQAEEGIDEVTELQSRLKMIEPIFAKHIYWTNFFKFLEDNTIPDLYYAAFSGDTSGSYALDARAKKYKNIAEQINLLRKNEKISEVKSMGGELFTNDQTGQKGVKFNINFNISKNIFTE